MATPQTAPLPAGQAEQNLEFEERWRTRAVVFAVLGSLIPLAGFIVRAVAIRDIPDVSIDQLVFIEDNSAELIISAILIGLGAIAQGAALYYLYRAVKGRRPELQTIAIYCVYLGAAGTLVSEIAFQAALVGEAQGWVSDNPQLADPIGAREVFEQGGLQALRGIGLAAQLAFGFAFVLISLNAMRVGLLTRFIGIIGIVSGVFLVIPLLSPLPIVQAFYLLALASLFAGRWPSGLPEAWPSGEARPWPSQQEMREERERLAQADERRSEADERAVRQEHAPEVDADGDEPETSHPVSKKRKKKRHR